MKTVAMILTTIGWVAWGVTGMRRHPPGLMRYAYWVGLLFFLTLA